jgi:malonyl CoA-acyl carrier protein transacylase
MVRDGAETFVEIGVGDVLSGLVRRIDRSTVRKSINDAANMTAFLENALN